MSGTLINSFATFGTGEASSTITPLGAAGTNTTNNTTVTVTTTVDVSAGETVIVIANWKTNGLPVSVGDGTANAYTQAQLATNDISSAIYYILNPLAIASGSTFTLTLDGSSNSKSIVAFKLNGTYALLDSGTATGTGTTASASTAGSVAIDKMVFGGSCHQSNDAFTQPGGIWVSDYVDIIGDTGHAIAHGITLAAGVVTYNPTIAGSTKWSDVVAAFG